jgi:uroporphyrinogen decarboxylase
MGKEPRYQANGVTAPDPDFESLLACIRREGTAARVHHMELFHDVQVYDAIAERFHLVDDLDRGGPHWGQVRLLRVLRFLGFDAYRCGVDVGLQMPSAPIAEDTAALAKAGGRQWHLGETANIRTWEDFERFPWPQPGHVNTEELEWATANVPDDMCLYGLANHVLEYPMWLMGATGFCVGIYEQPDLVEAVIRRCGEINIAAIEVILQFDRVRIVWGSDDMGFESGTFVDPQYMRRHLLPWHRKGAQLAHDAGRVYLLHACGNLSAIMEDLIEDVRIDAKHSFQDKFETVIQAKERWGGRIGLIGGVDVDFLCRADERTVREYTRRTLAACMPGGGYCLGTGNSVANYIPLDHYFAMVEEGYAWGRGG